VIKLTAKNQVKSPKILLSVRINPETLIKLRNFLIQNYGSTYYLGFVVEEAIKRYLDTATPSTHAHENQHMNNGSSPTKKHIELLKWLGKNYNYQVLLSDILSYIKENFGIDERTIKKYRNFLFKENFVKIAKKLPNDAICEVNAKKLVEILKQHVPIEELRTYAVAEVLKVQPGNEIKEKESIADVRAYAVELYRTGYGIEEIRDKLEEFTNAVLSKKRVQAIVRQGLREEFL